MTDLNTKYHFLSYLRRGLAASITQDVGNGQKRAEIEITLNIKRRIKDTGAWETVPIPKTIQLYGPGDIVGFDERMVVRTDPKHETGNFEPNYFPSIEFADPDFLWRFSAMPAPNDQGIMPWIVLVVLIAEDRGDDVRREFERVDRESAKVPVIRVFERKKLPNLNYAWRWAHVQAMNEFDSPSMDEIKELVNTDPKRVVSRLLCPRRLKPKTLYNAFVVPSFKLGWAAGIDTPAAWNEASGCKASDYTWELNDSDPNISDPIDLPYYYRWEFRTSERGDFEYLVRLLEPRVLKGLGLRDMDCKLPGFGLSLSISGNGGASGEEDPSDHFLGLEGSLKSEDTGYTSWGKDKLEADESPAQPDDFQKDLASTILNLNSDNLASADLPAWFRQTNVISSFSFEALKDGMSVRFSWTTMEDTTGFIEYGLKQDSGAVSYQTRCESVTEAKEHEVIAVMKLDKEYDFHLVVKKDGQEIDSGNATIRVSLPVVTPPIYGRWHAARSNVLAEKTSNGWLDVLNLDPRHRAAAGLGAEVVRNNQESLMASAWSQIGAIEATNEVLRRARFGRECSIFLHGRLKSMLMEGCIRITAPVHKRILRDNGGGDKKTVATELDLIPQLPKAALDPAFRRILRPRGPIRKRQRKARADVLEKLYYGQFRPAGDHPTPIGTPSPCEITKLNYLRRPKGGQETPEAPGTSTTAPVLTTEARIATGATLGTRPSVSIGRSTTLGISIPPMKIPFKTAESAVPASAKRFCENSITSKQIQKEIQSGIAGISDKYNVIVPAVCEAIDKFRVTKEPDKITPPSPTYFDDLRKHIELKLDPKATIVERMKKRLRLNDKLKNRFADGLTGDQLEEVMACPEFPQPMYEPLRDLSKSYILPGIEKVPNNTIGALLPNRRFLESYMVGLNHEFAAELLWRGFPTDQRGTCFRQFWDVSEYVPKDDDLEITDTGERKLNENAVERLRDINKIHLWRESKLGENPSQQETGAGSGISEEEEDAQVKENLVLIVRGDLIKRYPNAVIYSIDALPEVNTGRSVPGLPDYDVAGPLPDPVLPIFKGSLGADLVFLGFPFSSVDARSSVVDDNPGKFFIFEERVSEVRFGLDSADASVTEYENPDSWDDLHWGHFQLAEARDDDFYIDCSPSTYEINGGNNDNENWNSNTSAAIRAAITMQKPARLAVHADQILPEPDNS